MQILYKQLLKLGKCLLSNKVANIDYFSLEKEKEGRNPWEPTVRSEPPSLKRAETPHYQ